MEMAAGSSDDARLRMWVRAGLNEGCLGARLLVLRMSRELYEQWYDRYSSACFEAWLAMPVSCLHDGTSQGCICSLTCHTAHLGRLLFLLSLFVCSCRFLSCKCHE